MSEGHKTIVVVNQQVQQSSYGCLEGCFFFVLVLLFILVGLPMLFGCLGTLLGM